MTNKECFRCGQPAQWLITALLWDDNRAGRMMIYCTDCRNEMIESIGLSLDLDLIGDRMPAALDYLYGIRAFTTERSDVEQMLGLTPAP